MKMKLMLCAVLLVATSFCAITMVEASSVTLYTKTTQMENTLTRVEATDGVKYLLAVYQPSTNSVNCYTVTDKDKVPPLISAVQNDTSTVALAVRRMKVARLFATCSVQDTELKAVQILANLTNTTAPNFDNSYTPPVLANVVGLRSWLIYPGTKWCGSGNSADNDDDLGQHVETDKCCRAHDKCPHSIPTWTRRYDYFNWYLWTISICDCDTAFKSCLQSVSNPSEQSASSDVESIYFNILDVRCFILDSNGKAHLQ